MIQWSSFSILQESKGIGSVNLYIQKLEQFTLEYPWNIKPQYCH